MLDRKLTAAILRRDLWRCVRDVLLVILTETLPRTKQAGTLYKFTPLLVVFLGLDRSKDLAFRTSNIHLHHPDHYGTFSLVFRLGVKRFADFAANAD